MPRGRVLEERIRGRDEFRRVIGERFRFLGVETRDDEFYSAGLGDSGGDVGENAVPVGDPDGGRRVYCVLVYRQFVDNRQEAGT